MEAGDEGQRRYEEETHRRKRTAEGLNAAINGAMESKRKALTAPFTKFLAIANPANGKNFLPEVIALLSLLELDSFDLSAPLM